MKALITDRSFWFRQARDIMVLALIGIPFSYLVCRQCWQDTVTLKYSILVSSTLWITLSKGNGLVNHWIGLKVTWLKDPVKRLVYSLIGHTAFTVGMVLLLKFAFYFFFELNIGNIWFVSGVAVGVSLLLTLIMHTRKFLMSWRQLAIESERMKKEAISARYEALKNQVNPHFLFNSLNALSNLVYEDADLSAKFIKKLSDVYRYVLETREKELVPLVDELAFVNSYIFLQKIRHEESLIFKLQAVALPGAHVVPLSVQMLVENALKHNVISEEEPLTVEIYETNNMLVVENTLQKKNILQEASAGVGLENIQARYTMLSDRQVIIEEKVDRFRVSLPLIIK